MFNLGIDFVHFLYLVNPHPPLAPLGTPYTQYFQGPYQRHLTSQRLLLTFVRRVPLPDTSLASVQSALLSSSWSLSLSGCCVTIPTQSHSFLL